MIYFFLCVAGDHHSLFPKTSQSTCENMSWRVSSSLLSSPRWNITILSDDHTFWFSQGKYFFKIARFRLGRTGQARLNLNSQCRRFVNLFFSYVIPRNTVQENSRIEKSISNLYKHRLIPHVWNVSWPVLHRNDASVWQRKATEIPLNARLIQHELVIRGKGI